MFEHEAADLLAVDAQRFDRGRAGADEIAHGFVPRVGHPDRREFPRAKEPGQADGVPSIGFHPISRLLRDQRRGHDDAGVSHAGDQAMEAVTSRAGLVAELRPRMLIDDAPDQPTHALV